MIVLDTTVLLYAVGAEHPLREPCRRVVTACGAGRIAGATTIMVLQEFTHFRARRRPRTDATALARAYAGLLEMVETRPDDLNLALDLFCQHPALGAFDAVLAATALNHAAEALISADRAFGTVPGLPWVDPAGPGLNRLLTS
jgi:predicted nucleic acid-binding protein